MAPSPRKAAYYASMGKLSLANAHAFVVNFGLSIPEVARHCGVTVAAARQAIKEQGARNRTERNAREKRSQQRSLAARARERTKGEVHDLNVLLARVRRSYFPAGLDVKGAPSVRIRWGRDGNGRTGCALGSYLVHEGCITIHPKLERAPRCVIESTIYHELLHRFMGGRHTPEFRRLERMFRQWDESEQWLTEFNRRQSRAARRHRTDNQASGAKREFTREEILRGGLSVEALDTVGFGVTGVAEILQMTPYRLRKLIPSLGMNGKAGYLSRAWWSIRQIREIAARLQRDPSLDPQRR